MSTKQDHCVRTLRRASSAELREPAGHAPIDDQLQRWRAERPTRDEEQLGDRRALDTSASAHPYGNSSQPASVNGPKVLTSCRRYLAARRMTNGTDQASRLRASGHRPYQEPPDDLWQGSKTVREGAPSPAYSNTHQPRSGSLAVPRSPTPEDAGLLARVLARGIAPYASMSHSSSISLTASALVSWMRVRSSEGRMGCP